MRSIDRSRRHSRIAVLLLCVPAWLTAQPSTRPPNLLPDVAAAKLVSSLDAARPHAHHLWRDTPPFDSGDLVNAYVEIPRGERRKYEFAMNDNARAIDRIIPEGVGGYPVNYGFVPQTISYDGDPFDALVLGPALAGGRIVRGRIVGLMLMEDEKGIDSKVVLSLVDASGRARHALTVEDQKRIGDYFGSYKRHDPGGFSNVPGWGSADDGRAHVRMTHAFFQQCRGTTGKACLIDP